MNLDIIPNGAIKRVHVSQNDIGRTLTFELFNNSTSYTVPSGATVKIQGTKPSGFGFSETCTVSGNTATIDTTEAMTDESGNIATELSISYNGNKIGTSNFVLAVEKNPHPDTTTDGSMDTIIPELTLLVNEVKGYAEEIENTYHAYGSPWVASTVAEMTDTDKIYVYTGSESGYTNGNWYYWDGSAWISGGVYNSVAVNIDDTLTVQGACADAKAVGDAIDGLKTDLSDVTEHKNLFDSSEATDGGRLRPYPDGNIFAQAEYYTSDFIAVEVGAIYTKNSPIIDAYHRFCYYDSNKTCLGNIDNSNSITIESGTAWIRFCGILTEKSTAVLCKGTTTGTYTAVDDVAREKLSDTKVYQFISNGYIDPNDGVYHSYGSGAYKATDLIPVSEGNGINVIGSGIGEQYAWYDSARTYISGASSLNNVHTPPLAVPSNAKYFRMSLMPSGLDVSTLSVSVLSLTGVSEQLYSRITRSDIVINCVGDSVTEGMGVNGDYTADYGKDTYPAKLFTILKDNGYDVVVNNYGHGGERIPDISARIGAYPCIFTEDVTIPSNNTDTSLGTMTAVNGRVTGTKIAVPYVDSLGNDYCVFFTQTNRDTNPLYIEGNEYMLVIGTNTNYIKKRVADGESVTIPKGAFLFTRDDRNPTVNIVMGGINDGSSMTLKRYTDMMGACVEANGGKAIILGSTHLLCSTWSDVTGSTAEEKWNQYHRACVEAFGIKFVDLYYEFPLHAVDYALESGYWTDKTQADLDAIQTKLDAHIIPSELTVDGVEGNVHLNAVGYQVIAMLVFERLKRLNYI